MFIMIIFVLSICGKGFATLVLLVGHILRSVTLFEHEYLYFISYWTWLFIFTTHIEQKSNNFYNWLNRVFTPYTLLNFWTQTRSQPSTVMVYTISSPPFISLTDYNKAMVKHGDHINIPAHPGTLLSLLLSLLHAHNLPILASHCGNNLSTVRGCLVKWFPKLNKEKKMSHIQ